MKCNNKQQETAECEKRGCEGCFYNDEIKVGEYVRYTDGKIEEIITENKKAIVNYYKIYPKIIAKHSFNIIDLIEERRLCKWRTSI